MPSRDSAKDPTCGVNIRASRLGNFLTALAVWRYDAPDAVQNVLVYLSRRVPLDEQLAT